MGREGGGWEGGGVGGGGGTRAKGQFSEGNRFAFTPLMKRYAFVVIDLCDILSLSPPPPPPTLSLSLSLCLHPPPPPPLLSLSIGWSVCLFVYHDV